MGRVKIKVNYQVRRIDGDDGGSSLLGTFSTREKADAAIWTDTCRIMEELAKEGPGGIPIMERTGPFVKFVPVHGHEFIYSVEIVFV